KGIRFSEILKAYEKEEIEMLSQLLPLSDAILEMVVKNIPNPAEAQKYRVPKIWRGELESEIGKAMLNCDDEGPTMMCVTATQMDPKFGVVATGRIFSGSIKEGDLIYLAGADKGCSVQNVFMYMGAFKESVNEMLAGNIAALANLDFARAGETIVDLKHKDVAVPFERVKHVSEPVMTVVVEPKNPKDLPLLIEAMNRLCIEDPNLNAVIDKETGLYLLSGIGELHLEIALKSLAQHVGGIPLIVSNPLVAYRETILEKGETVTTKTSNRKNAFSVQVEPLEKDVIGLIEKGDVAGETELKKFSEILNVKAGYSLEDAEKLCAFDLHGNILLNFAEEISEIRGSVILGFKWACDHGPLCEEPLRGVKVKLVKAQISEDPQMREPNQIMRAVARAILGSALTAKPALLEPVYKIEVSVPTQWFGACSNILVRRRGRIRAAENRGALTMLTGYIPVAETFGLASEMRSATSGRAFWQCTFSHWEKTPENIATEVIAQIRSRRGLPLKIPRPEDFID
ncbi:MAG: EF-Tu/IF-2/RF-3 family GTPase, partial [Candidatus Bathyarchaeia archaeon]